MQNIENAVILAAGLGSRLGKQLPKPLVKIKDKMMLEYQLDLLKNIPNIYIVVGFKANELIMCANKIRKDIIFIQNHNYESTGPLDSMYMAYKYIQKPLLVFDGDTVLSKSEFEKFTDKCKKHNLSENIVGITKSRTEQPVYCQLENDRIVGFSRVNKEDYEFSGPYYIKSEIVPDNRYIFEYLRDRLPHLYCKLNVFEVDTCHELEYAEMHFNMH